MLDNLCLEINSEWLTFSAGKCPSVVSTEIGNCLFGARGFISSSEHTQHCGKISVGGDLIGAHCWVNGKELQSSPHSVNQEEKTPFPLILTKAPASHQALCPQGCTLRSQCLMQVTGVSGMADIHGAGEMGMESWHGALPREQSWAHHF